MQRPSHTHSSEGIRINSLGCSTTKNAWLNIFTFSCLAYVRMYLFNKCICGRNLVDPSCLCVLMTYFICECNLSCAESRVPPPLTVAHCKQSGMEVVSQALASWAVSKRANPCLLEIMDSYKQDIETQLTQGVSPQCVMACSWLINVCNHSD